MFLSFFDVGIVREDNVYFIQPVSDGVELICKYGDLKKFLENPTQEFKKLQTELSLADYFICSKFIARRELVEYISFDWQRMVIRVTVTSGRLEASASVRQMVFLARDQMDEIVADLKRVYSEKK